MTDSDREKRWMIHVCRECGQLAHGPGSHRTWTEMTAVEVVPLERAQELKRERDEAVAAARDFEEALNDVLVWTRRQAQSPIRRTGTRLENVRRHIDNALARHPSFLPPDREE